MVKNRQHFKTERRLHDTNLWLQVIALRSRLGRDVLNQYILGPSSTAHQRAPTCLIKLCNKSVITSIEYLDDDFGYMPRGTNEALCHDIL